MTIEEAIIEPAVEDQVEWADPVVTSDAADDAQSSSFGGLAAGAAAAAASTGGFVVADELSDNDSSATSAGPNTEPIPVVEAEIIDEQPEATPMELDDEPSELFGTEVEGVEDAEEIEVEGSQEAGSFVARFAESLDSAPIIRPR